LSASGARSRKPRAGLGAENGESRHLGVVGHVARPNRSALKTSEYSW
jgi:hypothetical protein